MIRVAAVCDGGSRAKGGMASVLSNQIAYFATQVPDVRFDEVDPYGGGRPLEMMGRFLAECLHLARLRGQVQVAHFHTAAYGSFYRCALLSRLVDRRSTKIVFHIHASEMRLFFDAALPPLKQLVRTTLSRADAVVVLGESWKRYLADVVGVPETLITVVYNGVPGGRAIETVAPDAPHHQPMILFLGRLGERKGVPTLLAALAHPRMKSATWRAVLAGDGDVQETRAEVKRLGLDDRIDVPGWCSREATFDLLSSADILCLPSRDEGQPMAILEAMAHGLAIVATPVGAIPETIDSERSGLLVPVNNAEALAVALERCVTSPDLRQTLGAAAQTDFQRKFSIEAFGSKIDAVYRRLLRPLAA
jgi:glycosyltransferase involved in cell wall biosynthesis